MNHINNHKFISLSGKKDTGKSTVGELLKKHGWVPVSFADKIKQIISIMFGWNIDILRAETPEYKKARESLVPVVLSGRSYGYREAVLAVGDMLRTTMGEQIVVDMVIEHVRILRESGAKVCVTDARYCREIIALGPECVNLCLWRNPSDLVVLPGEHSSENDFLNMIDRLHVVDNSGSIDELSNKINSFIY